MAEHAVVPRDPTPLAIDLQAGVIEAGAEGRELRDPTADEVLGAYLSLLYSLRAAPDGSKLHLRSADLDVLSRTLHLAQPTVESRLSELMSSSTSPLQLAEPLRHRARMAFAAGALAVLAVGAMVAVAVDRPGRDTPVTPTSTMPAAVTVVTAPDSLPISAVPEGGVGLVDPQVLTRDGVAPSTANP